MTKIKEKLNMKPVIIALKVIRTIGILMILAFALVVYLQRFSDNRISIFSYRMFTVVSESMEPRYSIGDVLIAREVPTDTLRVGDDISYRGMVGDFRGKVITHEIVGIEEDPQTGENLFFTKGLASLVVDPVVHEDQIYGKIVYKSVFLSAVYRAISTDVGFFLLIVLPVMFIIGSELIHVLVGKEDKRRSGFKPDKPNNNFKY